MPRSLAGAGVWSPKGTERSIAAQRQTIKKSWAITPPVVPELEFALQNACEALSRAPIGARGNLRDAPQTSRRFGIRLVPLPWYGSRRA